MVDTIGSSRTSAVQSRKAPSNGGVSCAQSSWRSSPSRIGGEPVGSLGPGGSLDGPTSPSARECKPRAPHHPPNQTSLTGCAGEATPAAFVRRSDTLRPLNVELNLGNALGTYVPGEFRIVVPVRIASRSTVRHHSQARGRRRVRSDGRKSEILGCVKEQDVEENRLPHVTAGRPVSSSK